MNIAEIARRTRLEPRRLRYVADRAVVRVSRRTSRGRGVARDFNPAETVKIALAAVLIDRGISKRVVSGFVRKVLAMTEQMEDAAWITSGQPPDERKIMVVELADNRWIRFRQSAQARGPGSAPAWYLIGKSNVDVDGPTFDPDRTWRAAQPLAWVGIDLAELVRCLTQ